MSAKRRRVDAERKQRKRKQDAELAPQVKIPLFYQPERHLLYDAPANCASFLITRYLRNLQGNQVVARPNNWSEVLNNILVRKKYGLSTSQRSKRSTHEHVWNHVSLNHCPVSTHDEFRHQLDSGLSLPVLILPGTELSLSIASQSIWSGRSLNDLLDEVLKEKSAVIKVQDHGLPNLCVFTTTKTCEEVRSRFNVKPEDRGCPWDCLKIFDDLYGFKGPKLLEYGASLRKWQLANPSNTSISLKDSAYAPVRGSECINQWLLISEKHSASTAHVDVAVATWVSCLVGMKTFWIRNPSIDDQLVWENFNIDDDHRLFSEPWARIDVYPGSTL